MQSSANPLFVTDIYEERIYFCASTLEDFETDASTTRRTRLQSTDLNPAASFYSYQYNYYQCYHYLYVCMYYYCCYYHFISLLLSYRGSSVEPSRLLFIFYGILVQIYSYYSYKVIQK